MNPELFRMPAEWEHHEATWLTWPRREGVSYPGRWHDRMAPSYLKLIEVLASSESVRINVFDQHQKEECEHLLRGVESEPGRVQLFINPSYEPWCRDHGPVFVVNDDDGERERAVVNWGYNAWGGKYPPFELDDRMPLEIAQSLELSVFEPSMILEGGSIESNGAGTILTTESCLLNPNRNPDRSREEIESRLRRYLGCQEVLWLGDGIAGDDTDGHVDDITRFVGERTVVTAVESDQGDINYLPLRENLDRLRLMSDTSGRSFDVIEMPMPAPFFIDGERMPASYLNFYIANEVVVVPIYEDPRDAQAIEILEGLFPSRRVEGIDSREIIWGLGSFHCLTQQEPSVQAKPMLS
jgi:agmatine deiminase